ncbi:glycosyltransferase [Stakelama sp. CBK3Z-3]|uniref:Glycosyltransferase n=1 Tax=Stakelama flava TaxID=2860338 RepID=A0ABS6XIF2_9SPHN|nr:glycosyltransferase [Stakelama flava]MBW4329916.1 glycosyltransferase [Stakelama flava]
MVALFLAIAAVVLLLLAAHPFVTYPLSLFWFARRRRPVPGMIESPRPSCAICISAYNEEKSIVAKVEQSLAMAERYGPATIHIYVDGCSDRTAELLQPYADRIDLVVSEERSGKTHGLNVLIERSQSDLLMFTDANVDSDADALVRLAQPFADPRIGCTTARLVYSNPDESATSFIGALYWRIEEAVKQIESDTLGVVGVDGASFMVRRSLYRSAPPDLIDDLYVTIGVMTAGATVVRVPEVVVQERSAVQAKEEFHRKMRISCQAMNVHRALRGELRKQPFIVRYGYTSHRLLKWLMPYFLLGAGLCALGAITAAFGWITGVAAILIAAAILVGGAAGVPVLSIAYSSALALLGVGLGIAQSLFGKQRYRTWEPAATIRSSQSTAEARGRS